MYLYYAVIYTYDIFVFTSENSRLPPTCEPNLIGSTSSITSLLEWSKRTGVFDSNRCHGRTRIQTEFHVSPHLLPRLEKKYLSHKSNIK
ncbi:unnamed protein product [Schistosoma curassoni]|uniref:TMEM219 domain-containing protein n=1 Tax=Schistosoma curassoni TaxID=6186 RepID=A0A183K3D2_9TREM|nr:unnamed protein product [Schistosoma curassoni]